MQVRRSPVAGSAFILSYVDEKGRESDFQAEARSAELLARHFVVMRENLERRGHELGVEILCPELTPEVLKLQPDEVWH